MHSCVMCHSVNRPSSCRHLVPVIDHPKLYRALSQAAGARRRPCRRRRTSRSPRRELPPRQQTRCPILAAGRGCHRRCASRRRQQTGRQRQIQQIPQLQPRSVRQAAPLRPQLRWQRRGPPHSSRASATAGATRLLPCRMRRPARPMPCQRLASAAASARQVPCHGCFGHDRRLGSALARAICCTTLFAEQIDEDGYQRLGDQPCCGLLAGPSNGVCARGVDSFSGTTTGAASGSAGSSPDPQRRIISEFRNPVFNHAEVGGNKFRAQCAELPVSFKLFSAAPRREMMPAPCRSLSEELLRIESGAPTSTCSMLLLLSCAT